MSKKYCFSTNKETFKGEFDSRAEAIAEGFEYTDGDSIMTGVAKPFEVVIADKVIYKLQEMAFEEAGDVSEDWLKGVSSEAQKDLDDAIRAWLKRHDLEPKFSCVDEIETHEREDEE